MPDRPLRVPPGLFHAAFRRDSMLPEFRSVRRDPERAARAPLVRKMLLACEGTAERLTPIPQAGYSLFTEYARIGVRKNFDSVYHARRHNLSVAALLALFRREQKWIDLVQEYIWSTCEETTWVPPEHASTGPIDLFCSETAFALAEISHFLDELLDCEIIERVRAEIASRILEPYLDPDWDPWWNDGHNNWTGVCAGAAAATFLYLEANPVRLARAVNRALEAIHRFIDRAFLPDGGSSEGIGYWQYGLLYVVYFGELLRRRTAGRIDLLRYYPKLRRIALFPLAACVEPGRYYSCSDSPVRARVEPGFIARLAERARAPELLGILARPSIAIGAGRFPSAIRSILWWDGRLHRPPKVTGFLLPDTGVARLVAPGRRLVLMAKAGHNAENHNHNDVGSFALYVDGEPVLCDPGAGQYDREYFGPRRYENPVCNSYGHSVPVIDGNLQKTGSEHCGRITAFDPSGPTKRLAIEFADAYGLKSPGRVQRTFTLRGGRVELCDHFAFGGRRLRIEEAFVTWGRVSGRGACVRVRGEDAGLMLKIIEPAGAVFRVEELTVRMAHSSAASVLRRLACVLPPTAARFVMEIRPVRARAN